MLGIRALSVHCEDLARRDLGEALDEIRSGRLTLATSMQSIRTSTVLFPTLILEIRAWGLLENPTRDKPLNS